MFRVPSQYLWFKALRRIRDSWSQPCGAGGDGPYPRRPSWAPLDTVSLAVSNRDTSTTDPRRPMSIVTFHNGSSSVQPSDQELLQFPDGHTAKLWRTGNPNANSVVISVSPARSESNNSFQDSSSTVVAGPTPILRGSMDGNLENNNIACVNASSGNHGSGAIQQHFKKGFSFRGLNFPRLTNSFKDDKLELAYQGYSHRQRQTALVIVNLIDVFLKVAMLVAFFVAGELDEPRLTCALLRNLPWIAVNLLLCLLTYWKFFASNYLHWGALLIWIALNAEGNGTFGVTWGYLQFEPGGDVAGDGSWHVMFTVFVTYAMLPLPLKWCIVCGVLASLGHLLVCCLYRAHLDRPEFERMILTNACLYACINFESLLLSLLPRFVAQEIIKDISNEEDHRKFFSSQFHKIYIHCYDNVRMTEPFEPIRTTERAT
ncbi:adenylate cyclase, putative [Ixodes scapularis]|uniref:Adenylate cyclase, putative n=1 Tax=Ixodes scapularis TaxID=6945 RepID=B7P489_IXOSC|nr:adenylate cyclase, putative [Ixodes scapularis]|eukprot:XP_002405629.1 adenylate cyclase, putative [Ixodes scapularis]